MNKQIVIIEIVLALMLFNVESNAFDLSALTGLTNQLTDVSKIGQCGVNVVQDESLNKCKEKVTDQWKISMEPDKQACCKSMGTLDCLLETAKRLCSEADFTTIKTQQTRLLDASNKTCMTYRETPSLCGTCALLPVLSLIMISILAVARIS